MASDNIKAYKKINTDEYADSEIVYGSVAYDLNVLPKRKQEEHGWENGQVKTKTFKVAKPQKQGVSLFAVVGFAIFVIMMVFVLAAEIQLTQIIDETAQLESRIKELEVQEARLKIEYESTFNLTEIEEYASKKLGMVRKTSENMVFLKETDADRAVIIENEKTGNESFFDGLKSFLASLLEYF